MTFIGPHAVGKTTVVCGLVSELNRRGLRVGVLKSTKENRGETDRPGSDTWRVREAGAVRATLWAREEVASFGPGISREQFYEVVFRYFPDCDFVLAEGFKGLDFLPKIEVARKGVSRELLAQQGIPGVIALVTDLEISSSLPRFSLQDFQGLADFLLARFYRPRELEVILMVDGKPVALTRYVKRALHELLSGFLRSLRGVSEDYQWLELRIKKR